MWRFIGTTTCIAALSYLKIVIGLCWYPDVFILWVCFCIVHGCALKEMQTEKDEIIKDLQAIALNLLPKAGNKKQNPFYRDSEEYGGGFGYNDEKNNRNKRS